MCSSKFHLIIFSAFFLIITFTNVIAQIVPETEGIVADEGDGKDSPVTENNNFEGTTLTNDVLLSIGFNLNLLETTTQTSGLYYDINTFIPSLHPGTKVGNILGLDLRFNQGTFIPKSYGEMERTSYYRINEVNNENLISILKQDYIDKVNKVESYLVLSVSPTFKIKEGFPIYLAAHFEFLRKTTDFITTTTMSNEEDLQITPDQLENYVISNRRILAGERVSTTNDHIFNRGIGVKLYKDINGVTVNLKIIVGDGTNPDFSIPIDNNIDRKQKGRFYFTHFEVAERQFGIKLGGEIRGFFRTKEYDKLSPSAKRDFEPYSNIYIAKVFKFSKISDLIEL